MPNPRRSLFGTPTRAPIPSKITEELVPLMGGLHTDVPGILLDTASSASMLNFVPLDGYIAPRSRLSSLGSTVFPVLAQQNTTPVGGIVEYSNVAGTPFLWSSCGTSHAIMWLGSMSLASFTSAIGIGSQASQFPRASSAPPPYYTYAPIYISATNDIMLAIASQSMDTIMAGYRGAVTTATYSYLTGAPRTLAVAAFDNYLLAWNTWESAYTDATGHFPQRVRWSDRGDPTNWATGIAGFEDLLAMPGSGTWVGAQDGRLLLFTDCSLWQGVEAAYPAQFQFAPLEPEVGCPYPRTIQHTPEGLLFMDQAANIRLLPKVWGLSRIVSSAIRELLQANIQKGDNLTTGPGQQVTWALFDPTTQVYWLYLKSSDFGIRTFTLRLATSQTYGPAGAAVWTEQEIIPGIGAQGSLGLTAGTYCMSGGASGTDGGPAMVVGDSNGVIYSFNSTVRQELNAPAPTSTWKSRPLGGDYPGQEKTVMEVRFDYKATSASSATVHVSFDNGNSFVGTGFPLSLGTCSFVSQAIAHVYGSSRYPLVRWQSESTGYQLHRCHAIYRVGGR